MIPLLWLAGAALVGVVGGVAIAVYWKEIIGWIEKYMPNFQRLFNKIYKVQWHLLGSWMKYIQIL